MTEADAGAAATAGALLRRAREAQGLHVAALAAALKVAPRKLEALERDRYEDLPDTAFTRALAKSACRVLRIDAAPILALLPQPDATRLDHVGGGLNTPFREHAMAGESTLPTLLRTPMFWIVAVLAIGAAAIYFWPLAPVGLDTVTTSTPPAAVVAPAPSAPAPAAVAVEGPASAPAAAASEPLVETVHDVPKAEPGAPVPAAPPVEALLVLSASEGSWIEVVDGQGRALLSRTVQPGETVGLDGPVPLRVVVGNAAATQVTFRGESVDVERAARDNVARLELR